VAVVVLVAFAEMFDRLEVVGIVVFVGMFSFY
jgi:hypothetical protein